MSRINFSGLSIPDAQRLFILSVTEKHYGDLAEAQERTAARRAFLRAIAEKSEGGQIALCSWSRDCDCVEGTSRTLLPATATAIDAAIERDFEYAEGPVRHWLQRPSEPFEAQSRDRIAEAHENGHPWRV